MSANKPHLPFACPALSSYPTLAHEQIRKACDTLPRPICVIGSSLGGFWATYLVEHGLADKAVLINPAVSPHTRFDEFVGRPLAHYSGEHSVTTLGEKDLQDLIALDTLHITRPKQYWLMVQTADETLDYQLAVAKYHDCKQLIEHGGNHSFIGYENWLPRIIDFFEEPPAK